MQMKFPFLIFMLCTGFNALAQKPTAAEIKKFKIKKITRQDEGNKTAEGRTEWYYNSNGDDTATYNYGARSTYKTIIYDAKQRIKTITQFSDTGAETEITEFTYKTDGSYTAVNKDKQYGMTYIDEYDVNGLKKQTTIPDGSVHHYVYNAKNQLVKLYSEPKNGGMEFTVVYTYNTKGNMITQVNKGEYSTNNTYEYDVKGLLKKATIKAGNDDEEKQVTVYVYSYAY